MELTDPKVTGVEEIVTAQWILTIWFYSRGICYDSRPYDPKIKFPSPLLNKLLETDLVLLFTPCIIS
jgi:hypothetical protein